MTRLSCVACGSVPHPSEEVAQEERQKRNRQEVYQGVWSSEQALLGHISADTPVTLQPPINTECCCNCIAAASCIYAA